MIKITWDDSKVANDNFPSVDYNAMVTDQKTRSIRSTGAGAPSTAPANTGDIYIDTTNKKMYIAMGTSAASDWKKVVSQ
ncbi:MAG: hypothetical protein KAK00_00515 [Nanoarchaeota archaeon]|nr:hypothetical protein [Nanoarchaeota archaeon]